MTVSTTTEEADPVAILDRDGRIVEVNEAWRTWTGGAGDDPDASGIGGRYLEVCDRAAAAGDSTALAVAAGLRDLLAGRIVRLAVESESVGAGPSRLFEWRATALVASAGAPHAVRLEHREATARRRARPDDDPGQEQRRRARLAELGAIAARVVDQVGNPLAGILNQAQLLRRRLDRGDPPEAMVGATDEVIAAARRLVGTIESFRRFCWDQRLVFERVDSARFLAEARERFLERARQQRVEIELNVPPEAPPLRIDAAKLAPVLDNLIENALEAEPRSRVVLEAAPLGEGGVRISIVDDGNGIPNGITLFRLFETTKPNGNGLGLALSKEIALAHGGDLTAERRPRGTALHLDLPAAVR